MTRGPRRLESEAVPVDVAAGLAEAAAAGAGRLIAGGLTPPGWWLKRKLPLQAGPFTRLADTEGELSALVGSFRREGNEHAFMIVVDHDDCGAAADMLLIDGPDLPKVVGAFQES